MDRRARITIELRGGFANQLFQLAIAQWLEQNHRCNIVIDARVVERPGDRGERVSEFSGPNVTFRTSGLVGKTVWAFLYRTLPIGLYTHVSALLRASRVRTTASTLEEIEKMLADGQSEILVAGYLQEIDFLQQNSDSVRKNLQSLVRRSVAPSGMPRSVMHVRRGDYADTPANLKRFGVCSLGYYVTSAGSDPWTIVSDDRSWCEAELLPRLPPGSEIYQGRGALDDFAVLMGAERIVMSNSTFSWWAAYLGSHKHVVGPSPWDNTGRPSIMLPQWHAANRDLVL